MEDVLTHPDGYTLLTGNKPNKQIMCPDRDLVAKCVDAEKGEVEITLLKGRFVKRK